MKMIIICLALMDVGAKGLEDGCHVTPNAGEIDWERLSSSGNWYQALNTKNNGAPAGSCMLIRVQKQEPGQSSVSFNLRGVGASGHRITVYKSWLPAAPNKTVDSPTLSAILSTMRIDRRSGSNFRLAIHNYDVAPEHFITDYETYFIGKMCWREQVYLWAYTKEKDPSTSSLVGLFLKITTLPDYKPVTFAQCNEVQNFALDRK